MPSKSLKIISSKFARWHNLMKDKNSRDMSAIISIAVEYYLITGRFIEIARVVPDNSYQNKRFSFNLYVHEGSAFANFCKIKVKERTLTKELVRIMEYSISEVSSASQELVIPYNELKKFAQRPIDNLKPPIKVDYVDMEHTAAKKTNAGNVTNNINLKNDDTVEINKEQAPTEIKENIENTAERGIAKVPDTSIYQSLFDASDIYND